MTHALGVGKLTSKINSVSIIEYVINAMEKSHDQRLFARRLLAIVALSVVMAACGQEKVAQPRQPEPAFNQPVVSEYFLNPKDDYFKELKETLPLTDNPVAIANINRLLKTPVAQWLNGSIESTRLLLKENLEASVAVDKIPIFVAYNIPNRDLGGEAKGGMINSDDYRQWIDMVSETIGSASAIMILEPDALAGLPEMPDENQKEDRVESLRYALTVFQKSNPHMAVYLDAGNSAWLKPHAATDLISQVDPNGTLVGGIALNVSSRRSDADTVRYADVISQGLGRRLRVMIDNSRNGARNTDNLVGWCNVNGERVGTLDNIVYSADSYVETSFIKTPGESDGRCGESDKRSGEFDSRLLLDQVS